MVARVRAGWMGVAAMASNGKRLKSGAYGPLPGPVQTVPRAELYAVCIALHNSVGPITVHTDHKNIVTQITLGENHTTEARHPNADLWR